LWNHSTEVYRWNVIDKLAKSIRRQMKATKQRGGVPAYLNLYNIVNWTTTYEPTATLEELMSISLVFITLCMHLEKFRACMSFYSFISVTYNYLLIFYDILVFTMYREHVRSCLSLLLNLRYTQKTDGTFTYDSEEEDN